MSWTHQRHDSIEGTYISLQRAGAETMCWSGFGVGLAMVLTVAGCTPRLDDQKGGPDSTLDTDTGAVDTDPPLTLIADDVEGWVQNEEAKVVDGRARLSADGESIEGTVAYQYTANGFVTCTADAAFTGIRYESACEDCDFAFSLHSELEPDVDGDGCIPSAVYTFVEDDDWINPVLAFAASIDMPDPIHEQWTTLYDVTFISFDPGSEYVTWVPYYDPLTWTGELSSLGEASYADRALDWHVESVLTGKTWAAYQDCGSVEYSEATTPYAGHAVSGALRCPGDYADGWAVELHKGDLLSVSVDTLERESAFSPDILVNDPAGCTVLVASTNFICKSDMDTEDYDAHCPSGRIRAADAGQYTIWVEGLAACQAVTGDGDAQYQLLVDRE